MLGVELVGEDRGRGWGCGGRSVGVVSKVEGRKVGEEVRRREEKHTYHLVTERLATSMVRQLREEVIILARSVSHEVRILSLRPQSFQPFLRIISSPSVNNPSSLTTKPGL